jgi:hypothetical protein
MAAQGRFDPFKRGRQDGRFRRVSSVAAYSGDRLLLNPQRALRLGGANRSSCPSRAIQQPSRREPPFMPLFRHCRRGGATAGRVESGERMRDNAMRHSAANQLVAQPLRAADAREAEMLASAFAESQRALKIAVRVVSTQIVRAARVAPSCTGYTRPPTGRSRSGSRTTLASSWAAALCPTRTESGMS